MNQPKTKSAEVICRKCKHEFTITLEFNNPKKRHFCPKCNSPDVRGKKHWKPGKTKKTSANINLGWFDDVDEPAEGPPLSNENNS